MRQVIIFANRKHLMIDNNWLKITKQIYMPYLAFLYLLQFRIAIFHSAISSFSTLSYQLILYE